MFHHFKEVKLNMSRNRISIDIHKIFLLEPSEALIVWWSLEKKLVLSHISKLELAQPDTTIIQENYMAGLEEGSAWDETV
ncbi:unnamed protein product [Rotaria socialis]